MASSDLAPPDLMGALAAGTEVPLADQWSTRIEQHRHETYAGVPLMKFPEDLRTYERILWESAPQVVIELGVFHGGSALWLRDRLFDLQRYRSGPAPLVIGVDVDLADARRHFEALPPAAAARIDLVAGDVGDPDVLDAVRAMVPAGADVLVIDDAAHDARTTRAALEGLAPLIRGGGFFVVEDTCVDVEPLRVYPDWPRGAGTALEAWLAEDPLGRRFQRRADLQAYGLTCHPGGVLQRRREV
jgi:cephalosporin hydroxylase